MNSTQSSPILGSEEDAARRIYEDEFECWTDRQVLEDFRQLGGRARVFNFDDPALWDPVKPHLAAPEVIQALDRRARPRSGEAEAPAASFEADPESGTRARSG